jgi:sugar lactone lactonase YvrE
MKALAAVVAFAVGVAILAAVISIVAPIDPPANLVLGQPGFAQAAPGSGTGAMLAAPQGPAAIDSDGHLYVADTGNNRVLGWRDASALENGAPADIVIGQPDFSSSACNRGGVGAAGLCKPAGIAVDRHGDLFVADSSNNRVLEYDAPFAASEWGRAAAHTIFGQNGDFTASKCNQGAQAASADTLCGPTGVAVDSAGDVYIADAGNNRVLEYNAPLGTGAAGVVGDTSADMVFGQDGDFSATACNRAGAAPDADTLCDPGGIAVDGAGNLYVADLGNNRVLEYNAPRAPGAIAGAGDALADMVLGQGSDFTASMCDPAGAQTLCGAESVAVDSAGDVYVADTRDNRVLEFNADSGGESAGAYDTKADGVLGQNGDFSATGCNRGARSPAATSLCGPTGVALDASGALYVTDTANNRVLRFGAPAPARSDHDGRRAHRERITAARAAKAHRRSERIAQRPRGEHALAGTGGQHAALLENQHVGEGGYDLLDVMRHQHQHGRIAPAREPSEELQKVLARDRVQSRARLIED